MISDDALGQNLYNQRQVVGVNKRSGEFPGLTHFRNKPEEGYLNLADIQYDIRQDDPDAFVDVILMETGDVDGDGSCVNFDTFDTFDGLPEA